MQPPFQHPEPQLNPKVNPIPKTLNPGPVNAHDLLEGVFLGGGNVVLVPLCEDEQRLRTYSCQDSRSGFRVRGLGRRVYGVGCRV